jgi:catechol 2,3-dioxygenase-like lactoylglutathione lyase family enzyme
MIKSFNHFSFTVSNIDKSIDYYSSIVGMAVVSLADRPAEFAKSVTGIESPLRIAYLQGHDVMLELIEYKNLDKAQKNPSPGMVGSAHICLNVDDIFGMVTSLKKRGIKLLGEPVTIPAGKNKGGFVVYALDPDNIVTEFIQPLAP